MVIDPTSSIGKLRLRCGDIHDLPFLPDEVYEAALEECSNNLPRAAHLCANYILGMLTSKTHRKLSNLEVWGNDQFNQYKEFIRMTIMNPNNMYSVAPIPYVNTETEHPLVAFMDSWNEAYACSSALKF